MAEFWFPCEKKLAFLQLLRSSEAAEKLRKSRRYWHLRKSRRYWHLRKSRRYWHLRKSRLLRRAAEKPAFMKLLRNSAEKLQKSQLFYSFYEAFTQSFVKIVMMCKSCSYAGASTAGFCEAFACSFYADLHKSCIKAAFLQLLRRPA